jgi:uncharacterized membrane-anchored protein
MTKSDIGRHRSGQLPIFRKHMQHASASGEVHSRPFPDIARNRVILHYAFISEAGGSVAHAVLAELCRARGESIPTTEMKYHEMPWNKGVLRWESHSEFSTFTFDCPAPGKYAGDIPDHPFGNGFQAPGTLISAVRMEVRPLNAANRKLLDRFDPDSLGVTVLDDGKSLLATDFRQDVNGMTGWLFLESDIGPSRIGAHAKTAIELDTYRTLAMLGLPLARSLSQKLGTMEVDLSRLTSEMKRASHDQNEDLLAKINTIAAELESDAAASLFRFGASRAYGNIVKDRISTLGSKALPSHVDIGSYLDRSLPPALRTCESVENRQANLSRKLARIANLLRTRVEIEIENQNRNLLDSMNRRTEMQLRLQKTVEGLSVAAVSYYVVGLFYYAVQAVAHWLPMGIEPKMATGMFVPVAVLAVWSLVRRIHRKTMV